MANVQLGWERVGYIDKTLVLCYNKYVLKKYGTLRNTAFQMREIPVSAVKKPLGKKEELVS